MYVYKNFLQFHYAAAQFLFHNIIEEDSNLEEANWILCENYSQFKISPNNTTKAAFIC